MKKIGIVFGRVLNSLQNIEEELHIRKFLPCKVDQSLIEPTVSFFCSEQPNPEQVFKAGDFGT
jgi:hypothetical protein